MSQLVAVTYPDQFKAEEVRVKLWKLQRDYLIELEDAVVVTKDLKGKVKLHQAIKLAALGALSGGFWGTLIGMIFPQSAVRCGLGCSLGRRIGRAYRRRHQRRLYEEPSGQVLAEHIGALRSGQECDARQGRGRDR